ncbi:hypothetical protein SGFS_068990 [Streptomyces graminofaciens]|uniref:Lipoprotein CseA n=1 Tax=Streptomyces graminofaciens TaxID=68212 RepID=A0ABN5VQ60_9ACTN|nr:hypothetical protein [Streptomyces graminofaciens]BBC35605.1 hypothetical protein SGFS_068990 [Streptomyces graminofaciens]
MRGLSTGAGPDPRARHATKAVITASAVLAALGLFVSACATGGTGARDEGPADNDPLAKGAATPTLSASASDRKDPKSVSEVVRMVRADPDVSKAVKGDLKPCVGDEYPVTVSFGDLTGGKSDDIVINVMTCGDAVGVGAYVFREENGEYRSVFLAEQPPVYAEIDRGELLVTQQLYEKGDPVSFPSGEEVITYRWLKGHFTERSSTRTEYGTAVGASSAPVPTPSRDPK